MRAAISGVLIAFSILTGIGDVHPTYDPHKETGLSETDYNAMLDGTPLAGYGHCFVKLERTYGVNGLFAIAVCHLESGLGKYQANTHNFFGFLGTSGRWMSFETEEDGIMHFGELISGTLYAGKTIDEIAAVYCPGSTTWASDVRWLMEYHWGELC